MENERDSHYENAIREARAWSARVVSVWFLIPPFLRHAVMGGLMTILGLSWLTASGEPDRPLHGLSNWAWLMDWLLNVPFRVKAIVAGAAIVMWSVWYMCHRIDTAIAPIAKCLGRLEARTVANEVRLDRLEREAIPATDALPSVDALDRRTRAGMNHDETKIMEPHSDARYHQDGMRMIAAER